MRPRDAVHGQRPQSRIQASACEAFAIEVLHRSMPAILLQSTHRFEPHDDWWITGVLATREAQQPVEILIHTHTRIPR
jgi:hypothetical protein